VARIDRPQRRSRPSFQKDKAAAKRLFYLPQTKGARQ
jgi:hypothetical protein